MHFCYFRRRLKCAYRLQFFCDAQINRPVALPGVGRAGTADLFPATHKKVVLWPETGKKKSSQRIV